jgi:hypothetical protein
LPGSASVLANGCTLRGAGSLSGLADSFRFLYQAGSGDCGIRAQFTSVQSTGPNDCIGVMVRETLSPGSEYALLGMAPDGTFRFQCRTNTGNGTVSVAGGHGVAPNAWALLQRFGNTFYGFSSVDGTNWFYVSSATFGMATNINFGFAVASGTTNALNTSTFTNLIVQP